ncbi:DUF2076 domain-containing protein [Roseococcus sp. SYP-B2431]|uniref:DUF2076 domain-containing protein n=1 Tax=Roseococcus sp. SYP-B2431 TaxID=2496640 RepID=UPI00103968A8|nr:DUF2076 family protein [Roseococcus sp. SYP-B2431]TCH97845.1 DUF2076 domain-containing protein [Roseococcus sp. SYP-B2431]
MTEEERRIITEYVTRVAGASRAAPASSGPWGGRVPQTGPQQAPLPPVEAEADALITELFNRYPEARFRITQTAFVQEHALVEAQNRIQQLEWELENQTRQAQAAQNRGFFGMGGSRPAPMPPPPQPQYPPNYNPQAIQGRQGSGFLGTALTTAAGVAGGLVVGNMLMNAFSGSHGAASAATGAAGSFGNEAVPASSAWTDPGAAAASSGWGTQDATGAGYDGANTDNGAMDAGYDNDASGGYDDGGGYDDQA